MLLQSWGGTIRILPALPPAWDHGKVKGLKARGNYTVDIIWKDHSLQQVVILAGKTGKVIVRYGDLQKEISLEKGERCVLDAGLGKIVLK
jgi:alpha-L-fucosidase 2